MLLEIIFSLKHFIEELVGSEKHFRKLTLGKLESKKERIPERQIFLYFKEKLTEKKPQV
jgi:hypothetical protein